MLDAVVNFNPCFFISRPVNAAKNINDKSVVY